MVALYFVGVDVGTTGVKAVVFDEADRNVASARVATPWEVRPSGGETDATELLTAAKRAVAAAVAKCPPGEVAGLGVAGLAESGVLLDSSGTPVAPVIAWHDARDTAQLEDLAKVIGENEFRATTGLPFRQQWSITKHRWLVDTHPEARRAVRRLNVPEWIVRGLGGDEATEQSLASRTGWLRLHDRAWWPEALDWSGAAATLMPPLVTAGTPLGRADSSVPAVRGAVLTVAGHDHQVAAIGAGAGALGDQLDSCGTAEALVRSVAPGLPRATVAELAGEGITVGWHAEPGSWCLLGATQGGLVLERILSMLGIGPDGRGALEAAAAGPGPADGAAVQVVAPDFGRIDVVGIGEGCRPKHVWRAAVGLVTEQAGRINDAMSAASGPVGRTVVAGGWTNSPTFMAAKARRFGPCTTSDVAEAGALGAAAAARTAHGATGGGAR